MDKIDINGKTYDVDENGRILGANASCFSDDHAGHPYCYASPPGFEEAEAAGKITRQYTNGWYYFVN